MIIQAEHTIIKGMPVMLKEKFRWITSGNSTSIVKCNLDFRSHAIHGYQGMPHYFRADSERPMAHLIILSLRF